MSEIGGCPSWLLGAIVAMFMGGAGLLTWETTTLMGISASTTKVLVLQEAMGEKLLRTEARIDSLASRVDLLSEEVQKRRR